MENINIRNKKYQKKIQIIFDTYAHLMKEEDLNFIRIIMLRFKKNSTNEYFIVLTLIYGFIFFGAMKKDDPFITAQDRNYIEQIETAIYADIAGDFETYVQQMFEMENDLFLLKIVIKYTVLNSPVFLKNIVPNLDNYYKSIGYIIPLLTLKESSFLLFFQDTYFKYMYPKEYTEIKKIHLEKTSQSELPGEYIISTINSLSTILEKAGVQGTMKLRKKSYFSLYGKYNNEQKLEVMDTLWIRLVFQNLKNLYKFKSIFESDFVSLKTKNYIKNPKKNWYKSIHYTFINPFRMSEILVELQIRTKKMNDFIHNNALLSHFHYTIFQHKWDPLFQEVLSGYNILNDLILQKMPNT